jgi:hypothetical protein
MAESEENVVAVHCKGGKGQAFHCLFLLQELSFVPQAYRSVTLFT